MSQDAREMLTHAEKLLRSAKTSVEAAEIFIVAAREQMAEDENTADEDREPTPTYPPSFGNEQSSGMADARTRHQAGPRTVAVPLLTRERIRADHSTPHAE